jgi:hypothetical protein
MERKPLRDIPRRANVESAIGTLEDVNESSLDRHGGGDGGLDRKIARAVVVSTYWSESAATDKPAGTATGPGKE